MIKKILEYLDKSWVKEQIWYILDSKGRESKNVSRFIKQQLDYNDSTLEKIVVKEGWRKYNEDSRMIKILKWVYRNIKYRSDIEQYKSSEYWAPVNQTLASKIGDCEDGALLLYCLARKAGIPREQLKVVAGNVIKPPLNARTQTLVGHAWVRYVSKKYPYNAFYLDWCYYPDFNSVHKREVYLDVFSTIRPLNSAYKSIWFVVDEEKGAKITNFINIQ